MNTEKDKLERKGEKEAKQVPSKKDKPPLYIRLIPILIPVIIISYILYVNFLPFGYFKTFTVDVGAKDDVSSAKDLYLKDLTRQERISERIADGDTTYRYMNGSRPIYFILSPEVRPDNETKISVELRFKSDADLFITPTDYKHYDWQPLYIASFEPVKQFGNISIFSKENKNFEDQDNVNDWILKNIPTHSRICLFDYELSNDVLINKDIEYKNEVTEINQTFRGTHNFFVYLKDNYLNLSIGKQDLNWYVGDDEYLVELYDINDNLIFSDIIMDDGVFEATKDETPQHKSFFVDGIEEGTYKLKLTNLKGEKRYDDSTVTNIRINTDRIITSGRILPLLPSNLFFYLNQNTTLRFNAWHGSAIQNITISGTESKVVEINETLLGEWVPVNLTRGSYGMSIEGNLHISGTNFAFTKDSYFYPYNYEINNEDCSWVIISDYDMVEAEEDGWITATREFDGSDIKLYKDQIVFCLKKEDDEDVLIDKIKVNVRQ